MLHDQPMAAKVENGTQLHRTLKSATRVKGDLIMSCGRHIQRQDIIVPVLIQNWISGQLSVYR
jgi:hypothetical protein